MLIWDDYRLVLAIHRASGLPGAADTMGVTLSTIFRRLERVEQSLEVRLFERTKGFYQPTDAGQELVLAAERMEQEALAGDRAVTGRDQQLVGNVRITSTESIAACFLTRHIPSFQKQYPGLSVEIIAADRKLSLADREADIALRPRRPKEETLVGRKIGELKWGIYTNAANVKTYSNISKLSDLSGLDLIGWEGSPAATDTMNFLKQGIGNFNITCQSSSLLTNASLAAAGKMLAPLPCMVGSMWPNLKPVLSPLKDSIGELWIVTHEDLRRNARIRVLMNYISDAAHKDAATLLGSGT